MAVCFESAAARHLTDASVLWSEGRFDNAFYLAGYVVECSLKAVIVHSGGNPSDFGHKLVRLEREGLDVAMALLPGLVRYRPEAVKVMALADRWSVARRYESTGETTREVAGEGIDLARQVFEVSVGGMFLDGLLAELPE